MVQSQLMRTKQCYSRLTNFSDTIKQIMEQLISNQSTSFLSQSVVFGKIILSTLKNETELEFTMAHNVGTLSRGFEILISYIFGKCSKSSLKYNIINITINKKYC